MLDLRKPSVFTEGFRLKLIFFIDATIYKLYTSIISKQYLTSKPILKLMKKTLLYLLIMSLLSGCYWNKTDPYEPPKTDGYRPIYFSKADYEKISVTSPKALKSPGKIYIKDNYLFINEQSKGVHVINNRDPKNPQKIGFIQIAGNVDIAVRGTTMYADNGRDLVVIDVSDPTQAKIVNRLKDVFKLPTENFPPFFDTFFECVDNTKGVVVGWQKVPYDSNLKCFR